jgi:hypothetical protein
MSFFEIKHLCKSFDTIPVINDFSIEIVNKPCAAWSDRTVPAKPPRWI